MGGELLVSVENRQFARTGLKTTIGVSTRSFKATSLLRPENSLIFHNISLFPDQNSLLRSVGNLVKFMKPTKGFSTFRSTTTRPKWQNSLYFP